MESVSLVATCVCCHSSYYCAPPKRVCLCLFHNFMLGHVLQPLPESLQLPSGMPVSFVTGELRPGHSTDQLGPPLGQRGTATCLRQLSQPGVQLAILATRALCWHTSSTSILTPRASSAGLLSLFLVSDRCSCMGWFCLRCGTFSLLLCLGICLCTSWTKLKAFSHLPCSPCMPLCPLLPPFHITHKLLVASLPQSLPLSQGLGSLRADPPSEDGGKEGIESSAFSGSFVTMSPWWLEH